MLTVFSSLGGALVALIAAFALGVVVLRRREAPFEIALALGAVLESGIVFVLLLLGAANGAVFAGVTAVAAVAAWKTGWRRTASRWEWPWWAFVILGAYGVWYLVNALAPEVTPDGITYHLGLPREYVRTGAFPDRAAFFDLVPQGMEMLYTVAYAFGRHAAAKLAEFVFFVAGLPLIARLGRRLGLSRAASLVVAVFYFTAPVIGLTGSSSYNDAAGVFFLLAALDRVLEERWVEAGMCAGFCYAIKMPGILVAACAVVWLLGRRRWRPAAILAVGAAIAILPWMARAAAITGNPVAPLGNRVFPNPYFHIATETGLAEGLRSMNGVSAAQVPWQLAFGDRFGGTYGPLLLALPLGLLTLRRREGRLLWLAAAVLAAPWFTNSGARFLMQPLVLAMFALAMVLPRPAAWAAVAIQAVLCWPHVLDRLQPPYSFRLHEFPAAAALGIEPEPAYLGRHLDEYTVARMIERATPPNSRTLALLSVASAYLDRDVAVYWQSAEADTLLDTLRLASLYSSTPVFDWKATWPLTDATALRFRIPVSYGGEWDINEVQILSGDYAVASSPQWTFSGRPNPWEGPLAFDGNLATRWRTWEPVRAGMTFVVNFGHAQRITSAVLVTHTPVFRVSLEVWGLAPKGGWRLLTKDVPAIPRAPQDLRLDAARALRAAGFRYLLVATGEGGNAPIGNVIVGHEAEWGMERAADAGRYYLLRIK
ncbi:MAG: hypothetical protein JST11_14885 [Acidobacteria bacterium]|nr:hypothetical protein [Acidobacteriota bacterium]